MCVFVLGHFPVAIDLTPPKTKMLPLKNSRWKTIRLPFGARSVFRGKLAVKLWGCYSLIHPNTSWGSVFGPQNHNLNIPKHRTSGGIWMFGVVPCFGLVSYIYIFLFLYIKYIHLFIYTYIYIWWPPEKETTPVPLIESIRICFVFDQTEQPASSKNQGDSLLP